MVAKPKKFQLIFSARNKTIEREVSCAKKTIKSSNTAELLGVTIDNNINFKSHIENICCKANNKIRVFKIKLKLNKCRTKSHGLNMVTFKGVVIWENLLNHFKEAILLIKFKTFIRK